MDRKEAIRQFRERKPPRGVYALRCTATGETWVEASPNLDAARNGQMFMLRHGSHLNPALQAAWNASGGEAFEFTVLEQLDDGVTSLATRDTLLQRKRHWTAQLAARPV